MTNNIKHFEELWNEAESISIKNIDRSSSSNILDELIMKLSLYRSLENKQEFLEKIGLNELREICFGEALFIFTKLAAKDNINAYAALNEIIKKKI
jgi:hypothetical protein